MSYDGRTYRIIDTPDYTYFIPLKQRYLPTIEAASIRYGQLYRYDKQNDEWKWLNATNGLSENIVTTAAYDFKNRQLAVGYDNGNIDLLHDNGDKVNVPGLMTAGSNASPDIQDMNFDETDGDLWVATSTGYVRIDPVKGEVITSRNYGRAVLSVAKLGDRLLGGHTRRSADRRRAQRHIERFQHRHRLRGKDVPAVHPAGQPRVRTIRLRLRSGGIPDSRLRQSPFRPDVMEHRILHGTWHRLHRHVRTARGAPLRHGRQTDGNPSALPP